jgi:phosphate transport system permease protein
MTPLYEWLAEHASWIPFFAGPASPTGRTILTIGLVLAVMVLPIMTSICREIFLQTPRLHQEAALALGATRWETVRMTVFPYARSGIVSGAMLAL